MLKSVKISAISLLLALPTLSQAQVSPYVTGGIGEAKNGTAETALRLGAGLRLDAFPLFTPSIEASRFQSDGAKGTVVNGKLDLPFALPTVTPFVKAGIGRVDHQAGEQEDAGMLGLGVDVGLMGSGVRLEGERFSLSHHADIDVWTLGLFYTF